MNEYSSQFRLYTFLKHFWSKYCDYTLTSTFILIEYATFDCIVVLLTTLVAIFSKLAIHSCGYLSSSMVLLSCNRHCCYCFSEQIWHIFCVMDDLFLALLRHSVCHISKQAALLNRPRQ